MIFFEEMKPENMIYITENDYYKVSVEEEKPRILFFSHLFTIDENKQKTNNKPKVRMEFVLSLGLNIFQEPDEKTMEYILENLQ